MTEKATRKLLALIQYSADNLFKIDFYYDTFD